MLPRAALKGYIYIDYDMQVIYSVKFDGEIYMLIKPYFSNSFTTDTQILSKATKNHKYSAQMEHKSAQKINRDTFDIKDRENTGDFLGLKRKKIPVNAEREVCWEKSRDLSN